MSRQLILSARPRSLDALVGQDKVVRAIRKHWASGRVIKNWLFYGPKGTGKTSLAKILALSYQCEHQPEKFGVPCIACRKNRSSFSIYEPNCASVTGIKELRDELDGAYYGPMGAGKYRVYVLDEVHRASANAQDLLLKYLEETPDSTCFILCSSMPHKIVDTLRSRCTAYAMRELDSDGIEKLVTRLLKGVDSELPADRLTDALIQRGIYSPRYVTQAVEKYLAGNAPDDAVQVEGNTSVDIKSLTRSVVRGNWVEVASYLKDAKDLNPRAVRASLIGYLRVVLLDASDVDERGLTIAEAIQNLCNLENAEDQVIQASLTVTLFKLAGLFSRFPL